MNRFTKIIWMFVPLGLLFLLSQFYRSSSAVIAIDIMKDLQLDARDLGLLSAIFFYAFALVQLPIGVALDLFGVKKTLVILAFVGLLGTLLFASSHSLAMALTGRALIGMGMACALMGILKLLINWFPKNSFATASGLILSVGTLGVMAATAPLALIVKTAGWRTAFYGLAACHLLIVVWIIKIVREKPVLHGKFPETVRPGEEMEGRPSVHDFLFVFRHPSFWLIAFTTYVRYGTYVAISALWTGPFLVTVCQFSLVKTGNFLLAFPLGFIIGSPLIGHFSDRIFKNRKKVVVVGMAGYSLMMLPLCFYTKNLPEWLLLSSFAGMGFFTSCGGVMYANIKELMPAGVSGLAMTGVNFFTMIGAATFQHGIGAFIKHVSGGNIMTLQGFIWGFRFCFVAALMGVVGYVFVREVKVTSS